MSHANESVHDMYPDPRKVLRGNGHVANLRCAAKYAGWIFSYLVAAIFLGGGQIARYLWWGFIEPFLDTLFVHVLDPAAGRAAEFLRQYGVGAWFVEKMDRFEVWVVFTARRVKHVLVSMKNWYIEASVALFTSLVNSRLSVLGVIIATPVVLLIIAIEEVDNRTGIVTGTGSLLVFVGLVVADLVVGGGKQFGSCSKSGAKRFAGGLKARAEEAQDRPGARRIYGKCPVTFEQHPKWFDNLFGDDEDEDPKGTKGNPWSEEDVEDFSNDTLVTDGGQPYVLIGSGWNSHGTFNDSSSNW